MKKFLHRSIIIFITILVLLAAICITFKDAFYDALAKGEGMNVLNQALAAHNPAICKELPITRVINREGEMVESSGAWGTAYTCLGMYISKTYDPGACPLLEVIRGSRITAEELSTCYTDAAEVHSDITICDRINNQADRKKCEAIVKKDVSLCEKLPEENGNTMNGTRPECIFSVTMRTKNYKNCLQLFGTLKNECLMNLAYEAYYDLHAPFDSIKYLCDAMGEMSYEYQPDIKLRCLNKEFFHIGGSNPQITSN